jgi:hypothetical protein
MIVDVVVGMKDGLGSPAGSSPAVVRQTPSPCGASQRSRRCGSLVRCGGPSTDARTLRGQGAMASPAYDEFRGEDDILASPPSNLRGGRSCGGAGDGNQTRMASLEDCARRVVRGLDLRNARVTGLRY